MQQAWPEDFEILDFFGVEPVSVQKYFDDPRLDPVVYTIGRDGLILKVVFDWVEAIVSFELENEKASVFFVDFSHVVESVRIDQSRAEAPKMIISADGVEAVVQIAPEIRVWVQARENFQDT